MSFVSARLNNKDFCLIFEVVLISLLICQIKIIRRQRMWHHPIILLSTNQMTNITYYLRHSEQFTERIRSWTDKELTHRDMKENGPAATILYSVWHQDVPCGNDTRCHPTYIHRDLCDKNINGNCETGMEYEYFILSHVCGSRLVPHNITFNKSCH